MRFFAIASVLFTTALCAFASPVTERQVSSVPAILAELSNTVTPLANQLLHATTENATQANLTPIIAGIHGAVTNAVGNLKSLSGQSAAVVSLSTDGTTTLGASDIATLLADIISLILEAVYALLGVIDATIYALIHGLCIDLVKLLFTLIYILLGLIDGLLELLVPLLVPVLYIVTSLGLSALLSSILGIL